MEVATLFEELKKSQSVMWGSGPFEKVEVSIVEAVGPHGGRAWLDIGCGTGGVSVPAAASGAAVTGVDLAPNLIATARERAEESGMDIRYQVGDVENLDFGDADFGTVTSSVGAIFAPDQKAAAREMTRVCQPGGRLAISSEGVRQVTEAALVTVQPFRFDPLIPTLMRLFL